MSGTAGLSAAKNRRSGNEVKFNGQSKSIPPSEQTSVSAQPIIRQHHTMPNPMEILKSHEFRLQELEGENVEQELLNYKVELLTLKTDFLTFKNELLVNNNKMDVSNISTASSSSAPNTSAEVTALQQRVNELNMNLVVLNKELTSIKQYIREKVEPTLTKVLSQTVPVPATVQALASAETPAPIAKIEPVLDNTMLTIGC